jgi:hypothetical protein
MGFAQDNVCEELRGSLTGLDICTQVLNFPGIVEEHDYENSDWTKSAQDEPRRRESA